MRRAWSSLVPLITAGVFLQPVISQAIGSVKVTLTPPAAVVAGAKWRLDWGTWQDSGVTLARSADVYQLQFLTPDGYVSPYEKPIHVLDGQTSEFAMEFATASSSLSDAVEGLNGVYSRGLDAWMRYVGIPTGGDSARSGIISHGQTTGMNVWVPANCYVKFGAMVSSELNHDFLRVYFTPLGGTQELVREMSGAQDWRYVLWGTNCPGNLSFVYSKDAAGSAGLDSGWIDQLAITPYYQYGRHADFDINGCDDLFMHHAPTKTAYISAMQENGISRDVTWAGTFGSEWVMEGVGAFDGNDWASWDTSDFILRHTPTGYVYFCLGKPDGTGWNVVNTELWGNSWELLGTPDLNGDLRSDFVLRYRPTGDVYFCTAATNGYTRSTLFMGNWNDQWAYVGSGDFNGDGLDDFILKHLPTGYAYFCRTKKTLDGWTVSHTEPWGNTWSLVGIGYLNDDLRSDLIVKNNTTGGVYFCTVREDGIGRNGAYYSEWGTSWQLEAMGDWNGDGRADLLLRHIPTQTLYFCRTKPAGAGWTVTSTEQWSAAWSVLAPKR